MVQEERQFSKSSERKTRTLTLTCMERNQLQETTSVMWINTTSARIFKRFLALRTRVGRIPCYLRSTFHQLTPVCLTESDRAPLFDHASEK